MCWIPKGDGLLDFSRTCMPAASTPPNYWPSRSRRWQPLPECSASYPALRFVAGYYRTSQTETYTEDSPGGNHDYFSKLAADWEAASTLSPDCKVRRFIVRSGVVLGRTGGMIKQVYPPFFMGLGGPIGSGNQFFPWIHIEDIAGIFVHGVESDKVHGVLNGVAPQIITNKEFTQALARAMWRPALIPLPALAVDLVFGKERATMMLEGQRVIPKRTLESGYEYVYPDIKDACKECAHLIIDSDEH
ncbi:unnamed protein product [Larinioides sclopetarius]|uniref:DUF1731 domain-containing protein n=1 Tax=Larinioides sclopetarius TaxID=280406 RepID=A0AAV2BUF2_9ARAC